MKKLKAYTLMEMLIVMTIMVIILGLGMSAYVTFTESTKFNEDVANIQSDILTMQRAAMLFKKGKDEAWAYGLGIDFGGVINGDGTYRFFKWCSGYSSYSAGGTQTSGPYPNYDGSGSSFGISLINEYTSSSCDETLPTAGEDYILSLTGYGMGSFNLGDDVEMREINICGDGSPCLPRFLLFEAVTGRVFFFEEDGTIIPTGNDIVIEFHKNFGEGHELVIHEFTGKTTLSVITPP